MTFDLCLSEPAGSRSLHRLVELSRFAAALARAAKVLGEEPRSCVHSSPL